MLTAMIFTQGIRILRNRELSKLRMPAIAAIAMVTVQFLLGATVIWTREAIVPNTLHVMVGAITFTIVFLLYARSVRYYRFASTEEPRSEMRLQGVRA